MAEVTPTRSGHKPSRHACPKCGAPAYKDHRRFRDRLISVVHEVRRYHCKECGWQGLLSLDQGVPSSTRSRILWAVVVLVLIPLIGLSAVVYWHGDRMDAPPATAAPSPSAAATSSQPAAPRKEEVVLSREARNDCVWGGPGEAPYAGTLTAALTAARLPIEIVAKFQTMRDAQLVTDRLELSTAGIRSADGRRQFGQMTKAMALGNTLCFNTKLNMPPDTITYADLYELIDDMHRRYTVMIVVRGGNVAVLEELTER